MSIKRATAEELWAQGVDISQELTQQPWGMVEVPSCSLGEVRIALSTNEDPSGGHPLRRRMRRRVSRAEVVVRL